MESKQNEKSEILSWLRSIGLETLEPLLVENDIDLDVIQDLNNDDLKEIGISLGNRKRLLKALAHLSNQQTSPEKVESSSNIIPSLEVKRFSAEHRHLTVMFCDLVGSTALSQDLHVEDLRELINTCQTKWRSVIIKHGGYIARYMGDGLLVYFGYPEAREDDSVRALLAGLALVAEMDEINEIFSDHVQAPLAIRVGVASGAVVVGDRVGEGESREHTVVGETPNLAARLQGVALPNTVVVSPSSRELASDDFSFLDLGEHKLKGIADPVRAYRVESVINVASRFEAKKQQTQLTPIVGRQHEILLLFDRFTQAQQGEGQVVLLSGEAGIGKSRIIESLRDRVGGLSTAKITYQCSQHYINTALHPVIQQLHRDTGIEQSVRPESIEKITRFLKERKLSSADNLAICCQLLSVKFDAKSVFSEMLNDQQRVATLSFLVDYISSTCVNNTSFIVVEDVHWADPSTLDFLTRLIARIDSLSLLLTISFRPEFESPWKNVSHITSLTLNRLSRTMIVDLIHRVTGKTDVPTDVCEQIIQKTDGIPLFVEEITKSIVESNVLSISASEVASRSKKQIAIPATLHDSLLARLDRLGVVKEVAQAAAVIGRQFSFDLLQKVLNLNSANLTVAIEKLILSGLVFRRDDELREYFIFKHALVQDAAYQSILRDRRRKIHKSIADAMVAMLVGKEVIESELIAYHYSHAHFFESAVPLWLEAAQLSIKRSSDKEAVGHLTNGLESLLSLPLSKERDKTELQFRILLAGVLRTIKGWGDEQSVFSINRARELCEKLDDKVQLMDILMFERIKCWRDARYNEALDVALQLRTLALQLNSSLEAAYADVAMGFPNLALGEIQKVSESARALRLLYDPNVHGIFRFRYGIDMSVVAGAMTVYCQVLLLTPERSISTIDSVIEKAREIDHAGTLVWALNWVGAQPSAMRGDRRRCLAFATEVMELPEHARSPMDFAWSQVFAGWSIASMGESARGLKLISEGIDYLEAESVLMLRSLHLALYLDCLLQSSLIEDSERVMKRIGAHLQDSGECFWNAEIFRLKAILIRKTGGSIDEIRQCLEHANLFTYGQSTLLSRRIEKDLQSIDPGNA